MLGLYYSRSGKLHIINNHARRSHFTVTVRVPATPRTARPAASNLAPALSDFDTYLFRQGTHQRLYERLGAHANASGTRFAVWAPNARSVAVIGDFNGWDGQAHPLAPRGDGSGIWEAQVDGARFGHRYKYRVRSAASEYQADKADPFAFAAEPSPLTGSVIASLDYQWQDERWMRERFGPPIENKATREYWKNSFLWAAAFLPSEPGRCIIHLLPLSENAEIERLKSE